MRPMRRLQRSKPIKRQTAAVFGVNSSVAVGERQYIQLIERDNSGDISKLETFVLDSDKYPGSSFLTVKQTLITTNYFGVMTDEKFDLKLIPEFDGSASRPLVVE